jgi:hypothetical protein
VAHEIIIGEVARAIGHGPHLRRTRSRAHRAALAVRSPSPRVIGAAAARARGGDACAARLTLPRAPRLNGCMRTSTIALVVTLAGSLAAGCVPTQAPQADASARHYIDLVSDGDFARARELLDPSLRATATDDMFKQLREWLNAPGPRELTQIGLQSMISSAETRVSLVYQLHCSRGFAVVQVVQRFGTHDTVVEKILVTPVADDLRRLNAFTFAGKGAGHYVFLALCVGDLALMIYALVACARTPMRRRKWAWILFILVGIARVKLDWTSGQTWFEPFSLRLPIVGWEAASPYAPHLLWLALPLGAIVFLVRRPKLLARATAADAGDGAAKG